MRCFRLKHINFLQSFYKRVIFFYIKTGNVKNTLQLSLDILNIGNMLNTEWGVGKSMSSSNNGQILKYEGRDASNVPSFSFNKVGGEYINKTFGTYYNYNETWRIQVGVRYIF